MMWHEYHFSRFHKNKQVKSSFLNDTRCHGIETRVEMFRPILKMAFLLNQRFVFYLISISRFSEHCNLQQAAIKSHQHTMLVAAEEVVQVYEFFKSGNGRTDPFFSLKPILQFSSK